MYGGCGEYYVSVVCVCTVSCNLWVVVIIFVDNCVDYCGEGKNLSANSKICYYVVVFT